MPKNDKKKVFRVPVEWIMYGVVEVEARNIDEAVEMVRRDRNEKGEEFTLPTDAEYVDGTFTVSEGLTNKDIEDCFN